MKTRSTARLPLATCIGSALFISLALLWPAHAATIGEFGILQGSANGGINPATGSPWQTGDHYRLAFVTNGTRNASSPDIADYDAFVQSAANAVGLGAATWRCVGQSIGNPSAQTNTGTSGGAGVGIFLLDGTTKIADNYGDLWNGSIDSKWNLTEKLTTYQGAVASGSSRKFGDTTQSKIEHGDNSRTDGGWWQIYNGNQTSQWHFYALSDPLTVINGGPDTNPPVRVSTSPADNSSGFPINEPLVMVFDETIFPGTGNITIRKLSGAVDTTISINDASQVTVAGKTLTIRPAAFLLPSTTYAVRIDHGAILDYVSLPYAGISDDSTWDFTTGADSFITALEELTDHINGAVTLSAAQIAAHKLTIDADKHRFATSSAAIAAAFDLVTTFDKVKGPLWVTQSLPARDSVTNDNLNWVIYTVMQDLMDLTYTAANIATHESLLNGFKFGSSANFPGPCAPPADPDLTHTATLGASYPNTVGRATLGDGPGTFARKPTGCYLAPGSIATITVPAALVGVGYQIRVGAHSWDFSARPSIMRLDRSSLAYSIDALQTKIASPLGGGIYIEVPYLANAGVVNVHLKNVVRSPFFSAKSFHTTTPAQWLTERANPAPWADFQSDKFMMQVPTNWISAMPDPTQLMADWDTAIDAVNDLMGFPRIRGKEAFYTQVDLQIKNSVFAPGYPSVNVGGFNAAGNYGGYANHYLVRGPQVGGGADIEFHEQGHGYFFPKFGGESESNVNLLYVPAMQALGKPMDEAFRMSVGYTNTYQTLDTTAVSWMCTFNFSPKEQPMADAEKAYQLKGHAKFVDIARLFGWSGLNAFWASFTQDEENGITSPSDTDGMLLRLCQSVGKDIRPLFHFWGVHPQNPTALGNAIAAAGIPSSPEIRDRLLHYKTLVPANNAAFRAFALAWWGHKPLISGFWEETDHAMQWDETPDFDPGGSTVRPNGDIYVEASATDIQGRVQELVDLYYPNANPPTLGTLSPADNATGVAVGANLVVTFNEAIALGTGNITIRNLSDGTQTSIAVTDATQVSISGPVLTINPTENLLGNKSYAIQIAATAIKDLANNSFAGIANDTTWNFASVAADTPPITATTLFQADFNGTTVSDVGSGVFLAQITKPNLDAGTSVGDWTVNTAQGVPGTNRAFKSIQGVGAANVTDKALRFGIDLAGWGASPILTANLSSAATLAAGEITVGFDYANATGDAGGGRTFFLRGVGADNLTVFELAFKSDAGHTRLAYRDSTNTINLLGTAADLVNSTGSSNNASGDYDDTIMKQIDVVIGPSTFDVFLAGTLLGDDLPFKSAGATGLNRLEFVSSTQWTGGWFDNLSVTARGVGGSAYDTWSGGVAFNTDTNGDGVDNGMAWVLGATNPSANAIGLLPTLDNTSDPDYFIYTYRRSDDANTDANTTIMVEYGSDLSAWTPAVHDGTNIIITPTDNFFGTSPGVDKVEVKIKRTLATGSKLFARLRVVLATP